MNEMDEEWIYKFDIPPLKKGNYEKIKREIKKEVGIEGVELLHKLQKNEVKKRLNWIYKNKDEYIKTKNELSFDIKKVKYKQMEITEFLKKYENFVYFSELLQKIKE